MDLKAWQKSLLALNSPNCGPVAIDWTLRQGMTTACANHQNGVILAGKSSGIEKPLEQDRISGGS